MTKRRVEYALGAPLLDRWTRYLQDVQELTLEGSVEPRRWIGTVERLWLGVAEDSGDWVRQLDDGGVGDARARSTAQSASNVFCVEHERKSSAMIRVPLEAFDTLRADKLRLRPAPLLCCGEIVARPGRNLLIATPGEAPDRSDAIVDRNQRSKELHIFDLPQLTAGMILNGTVWAEADRGPGKTSMTNVPMPVATVIVRVG